MVTVKRIMLTNTPTLKKEVKIEEAAKLLAQEESDCVVIVENNKPIGIVTEFDIVRDIASKGYRLKEPISKLMNSPVTYMTPDTKLEEASKIIDTKEFRSYPVVENERLVGLITETDIVEAARDFTRFHQIMQEVILAIFGLATAFFLFYFSPLGSLIFW